MNPSNGIPIIDIFFDGISYSTFLSIINKKLLKERLEIQKKIDAWHVSKKDTDFNNDEFEKALLEYSTRNRRFGDKSNFSSNND